jgi:hypothetical protein
MFGLDWASALPTWVKYVLVALLVDYIAVLVLGNLLMVPIWQWLSLQPSFSSGFGVWQLVTHLFVPDGRQALSVLFGLMMLSFTLPVLERLLTRRQLLEALAASWVAGLVASFAFNAAAGVLPMLFPVRVTGWFGYANAGVALMGLALPSATVRLGFVLPVSGKTLAWACGGLSALLFLAGPDTLSFYEIATWGGVMAWWHLRGPGRRRRELINQGRRVESRFQVLQGGRDDTVH